MPQPVTKLIIPAAGFGTRMLPATKATPKELLPVLTKPVIQIIAENAVKAGIRDIIIVSGLGKHTLEDHFDRNEYLENYLLANHKDDYCRQIRELAQMANFIYVRQKGPYGTATPVLNCKNLINNEPFAVVWADDIVDCPEDQPHLKQLMEVYEKYDASVITLVNTDDEGTKKYGIVEGSEVEPTVYKIQNLLEKPGPEATRSRLGSISGYILTPDIFEIIETMPKADGRERYLTDAIDLLAKKKPVYAKIIDGRQMDAGNVFNWLKTNIEFGLRDPEISDNLREFLKTKIQ